jgi:hypothetical protein
MQRFFTLIALFLISLPVGISIAGCGSNRNANFCNGLGFGAKVTDVFAIDLEPKITGISLAYGQTGQIQSPTATTCKGQTASVAHYNYGTTNLNVADISPTGAICGGTWNRNSPGGIADFTICTPPPAPGTVQITASGNGVTSNPVPVFIHPPITAITISTQTGCVSQNKTLVDASGNTIPLTATAIGPDGAVIPAQFLGHITYVPTTGTIVSIDQNGIATAHLPGSTIISANVSSVSSTAGYFYTCPPTSIAINALGSETATVTPVAPVPLTTTAIDKNGTVLTGLTLNYASTTPQEIAVSSTGSITSTFPSSAAITAICEPPNCNPAPINEIGVFGNGVPIVSNSVAATAPGRASNFLWMASPQSPYFTPVDLSTGNAGSPIKLPFVPNSMVADPLSQSLYFGSFRELMIVSASGNNLTKEDISVPGVVLAVSPDLSTVVINDQVRQVIYLYSTSSGNSTSIGGLATRAVFSPDGLNLYIAGPNNLYVHNTTTGWSTYPITATPTSCTLANHGDNPFCSPDLAVTVPSVAAFLSSLPPGSATTAFGFCPNITGATPVYYPPAASVNATTDHITATNDGQHVLGASANPAQFSDVSVTIPTGPCPPTGLNVPTTVTQGSLANIAPTTIDQVVSAPNSSVAFVTYTSATGTGLLPYYQPSKTPGSFGTLADVQLTGTAQAPLAGIFSPDNSTFFVSTTGDNLVHLIDTGTLTDTKTIDPKLTDPSGKPVAAQFLAVKPRPTT